MDIAKKKQSLVSSTTLIVLRSVVGWKTELNGYVNKI